MIAEARRHRREEKEDPTFCESCVNEDEAEDATFDDFPIERGVRHPGGKKLRTRSGEFVNGFAICRRKRVP